MCFTLFPHAYNSKCTAEVTRTRSRKKRSASVSVTCFLMYEYCVTPPFCYHPMRHRNQQASLKPYNKPTCLLSLLSSHIPINKFINNGFLFPTTPNTHYHHPPSESSKRSPSCKSSFFFTSFWWWVATDSRQSITPELPPKVDIMLRVN
jgi:hypothetical protein